MKANELMIGDWVLAYGKKTQIVWVGNIRKLAVRGFPSEFYEDEISPIPLTPEILEKNGFKFTDPWYEFGDFGVIFNKDGIRISITGKLSIYINYVHQLQHALRLYGIEKEVEL